MAREKLEGLEHEPNLLVANTGKFASGHAADIAPIKQVCTRGGPVEATDHVHKGALATPGRSHDRNHLVFTDLEVDLTQCVNAFDPDAVDLR